MGINELDLLAEAQQKLSEAQKDSDKKMRELFALAGEIIIDLVDLQNEVKKQKEIEKHLKEIVEQENIFGNLFSKDVKDTEIKKDDKIYRVRKETSDKIDLEKLEKLEVKGEVEKIYKLDETKMKKVYGNKDIFKKEYKIICYQPKLFGVENEIYLDPNLEEENKKIKKENVKIKKILDQVSNNLNELIYNIK